MTLIDNYFPFDTGPGAAATPARWRLMARLWSGSGVVPGYLSALTPSIGGTTVTVQPGAAWVDGYYGEIDTAKTVSTGGTNGMVTLHLDPTARTITLLFTAAQTTPVQNPTGVYEVPLFLVGTGGTVGTDIRTFADPVNAPVANRHYQQGAWGSGTGVYVALFDHTSYAYGGGSWDGRNFTCPTDGEYFMKAQLGFIAGAANQSQTIWLCHNSAQIAWADNVANFSGQYLRTSQEDIIPCSVGDTLQVQHTASVNGATGLVGSMFNFLTIRRLP